MGECPPSDLQSERDVRERNVRRLFQKRTQILTGRIQSGRCFGRQHQQLAASARLIRCEDRRFFKYDVGIRSADTECTNAGAAGQTASAANRSADLHDERTGREINLRLRGRENAVSAAIESDVSASTVLIKPAAPAAASRWPIFVFTEPMAQKPERRRIAAESRA